MQHIYDNIISLCEDLLGLFYPRVCAGCDSHLRKNEENLCLICLHDLPLTYFWDYDVTPVEKLFWGRLPITSACSYLHFEQESKTQSLMHRLKYDGRTGIGKELGLAFGHKLKDKGWFSDIDMIIPIPLHRTRELRRGYNQSLFIAEGIGQVYNVQVRSDILKRVVASNSQTNKSRFDRSENVKSIFQANSTNLKGKNVLLVDDVVTTGATMIAAGSQLFNSGANKIHVATLAIA